jgi:hypothetical protein
MTLLVLYMTEERTGADNDWNGVFEAQETEGIQAVENRELWAHPHFKFKTIFS